MPVKRVDLHLVSGIDILKITGSEDIQKAEESGDLVRYEFEELPWFMRNMFRYSRFYGGKELGMFAAFVRDDTHDLKARQEFLRGKYESTPEKSDKIITEICDLLEKPETTRANQQMTKLCMQFMMSRFCPNGNPFPDEILEKASSHIFKIEQTAMPWKMIKASQDMPAVYQHCREMLEEQGVPPHCACEVVHGLCSTHLHGVPLCRTMARSLDKEPLEIAAECLRVTESIRVPRVETTFNGLLKKPITPAQTVIILDFKSVITEEKKLDFVFSATGNNERKCSAYKGILAMLELSKEELLRRKERRASKRAAATTTTTTTTPVEG